VQHNVSAGGQLGDDVGAGIEHLADRPHRRRVAFWSRLHFEQDRDALLTKVVAEFDTGRADDLLVQNSRIELDDVADELGQAVRAQQARSLKHRLAQQDLGLALHQPAKPHHLSR
jgi:hypothetical protein